MAALSPVKNLSGNYLAMMVGTMLLMPSLILFWFFHATPYAACVVQRLPVKILVAQTDGPCQYCTSYRTCPKHAAACDQTQTNPEPQGTVCQGDPNAGAWTNADSVNLAEVSISSKKMIGQTSLVQQQAEQNTPAVAQNVEQQLWPDLGVYDTYDGLTAFGGDDIVSNLFANLGQLILMYCGDIRIQMPLIASGLILLWKVRPLLLARA